MNIIKDTEGKLPRISGLYQGEAFTGKTYAACTWPDALIINFDPDSQTAQKQLKPRGSVVGVIELDNWSEYINKVEPHIKGRTLHELMGAPVQTIVVDTMSLAATHLCTEIQGSRDKMRIQDYLELKIRLTMATMILTDTCKVRGTQPTYNVIFTTHLQTDSDDEGVLIAVGPAIPGAFRKLLPRMLGFAFVCENVLTIVPPANGKPATQRSTWQVRTVPPNKLYMCGDRIGDETHRLPAVTPGLYPDLMKAWGRDA